MSSIVANFDRWLFPNLEKWLDDKKFGWYDVVIAKNRRLLLKGLELSYYLEIKKIEKHWTEWGLCWKIKRISSCIIPLWLLTEEIWVISIKICLNSFLPWKASILKKVMLLQGEVSTKGSNSLSNKDLIFSFNPWLLIYKFPKKINNEI